MYIAASSFVAKLQSPVGNFFKSPSILGKNIDGNKA